jgi:hypothetical protein
MADHQHAGMEEPNVLDSPWLRRQVETHLLFGFFARRFAFGWIPVGVVGLAVLAALAESWPVLLGRTVTAGILLAVFVPILRMSRYRQAALGWWVTKASIAIVAFLFFLVGGLVGFFRGQPEAIHFTLLALIWFPGLEFIPSLVQHQRFITAARIILSVPSVVLTLQYGTWE